MASGSLTSRPAPRRVQGQTQDGHASLLVLEVSILWVTVNSDAVTKLPGGQPCSLLQSRPCPATQGSAGGESAGLDAGTHGDFPEKPGSLQTPLTVEGGLGQAGGHGGIPHTATAVGIYGKDVRSQGTRAPLGGGSLVATWSPERLGSLVASSTQSVVIGSWALWTFTRVTLILRPRKLASSRGWILSGVCGFLQCLAAASVYSMRGGLQCLWIFVRVAD